MLREASETPNVGLADRVLVDASLAGGLDSRRFVFASACFFSDAGDLPRQRPLQPVCNLALKGQGVDWLKLLN